MLPSKVLGAMQEIALGGNAAGCAHHRLDDDRRDLWSVGAHHALERIDNGTYGVCEMTGQPIGKARLDAKPWAKLSIEAARMLEHHSYHRS